MKTKLKDCAARASRGDCEGGGPARFELDNVDFFHQLNVILATFLTWLFVNYMVLGAQGCTCQIKTYAG